MSEKSETQENPSGKPEKSEKLEIPCQKCGEDLVAKIIWYDDLAEDFCRDCLDEEETKKERKAEEEERRKIEEESEENLKETNGIFLVMIDDLDKNFDLVKPFRTEELAQKYIESLSVDYSFKDVAIIKIK